MSIPTNELLNTTDGMVWAEAFAAHVADHPEHAVDRGFLVGWFANAIETGRSAGASATTAPQVWSCKIGSFDRHDLPDGADLPMRHAVQAAYEEVTGATDDFCFSGWAGELTDVERAIAEGS